MLERQWSFYEQSPRQDSGSAGAKKSFREKFWGMTQQRISRKNI